MKKPVFLIFVIILCMFLGACDAANYKKAEALFAEGNYSAALPLYTALGEYEDAHERAAQCEREIGMTENADYRFLEDIELSVTTRNQMVNRGDSELTYLSAELAILEDYYNAEFYDSALEALAKMYIDGVREQKDALDLKYSEFQIKWHSGLVNRYQALCKLHSDFGIFEDDVTFKSTYVAQLSYHENQLAGLRAIESDLIQQLDGITFTNKSSYQMTAPYTNNTEYDFSIQFYFTFYNKNGVRVDESTTYFSNIKSGDNCTLEFWRPSNWSTCEFFWDIYDIK